MTERVRVAHLISHPIQYFAPLYRELTRRNVVDLTVFFRSDRGVTERVDPGFGQRYVWDIPLTDGYRWRFLSGARGDRAGATFSLSGCDLPLHLAYGRYQVLWVHGYSPLANQCAMAAANLLGIPVLLRDDTHLLVPRSAARRLAKSALLPALFRLVSGGLYIGQKNRAWFLRYGLPPGRMYPAPYAVDNDFFQREAQRLQPERATLRARWGFTPEQTVFLFMGKLHAAKAPLDLLEAFAAVSEDAPCGLLIAGDGPLRGQIEAAIRERRLAAVQVAGFLNQSEVGAAYAAADVLVLPSRSETWGLVANEAMNFGLPVIASDRVGCAGDLVQAGVNGYVFPAGDRQALEQAMRRCAGDPVTRRRYGMQARQTIEQYTLDVAARAIEAACRTVAERSHCASHVV